MVRRLRFKVQWYLTICVTILLSGTLLYKNVEFLNERNRHAIVNKIPKKALLSFKFKVNVTEPTVKKVPTKNLRKKHVTKSMSELGKMDEINRHFLFLNSVPKSGSEILVFLLEKIQGVNSFKHVRLKGDKKKLTKIEQESLVDEMINTQRDIAVPLSFDRMVYFVNFTTFDKQSPTYINLIRHPITKVMTRAISKKIGGYDSYFVRCLSDKKINCNFKTGRPYDLTIPYFCGHDSRCMLLNDKWALEIAKQNVEKYYPVVGVLEELNSTLSVLERKVPHFFRGAMDTYFNNMIGVNKHKKMPEIPEHVKTTLENTLTLEIDFYKWIRSRLLKQAD